MSLSSHDLITTLLDRAVGLGAAADVVLTGAKKLSLKAQDGELSEYSVASTRSVGIRLIKDAHVGMSYSESLEPDALDRMFNTAVDNARFSRKNPDESIVAPALSIDADDAERNRKDTATTSDKIETVLHLERAMADRPIPAKAPYNGLVDVEYEHFVANTNGASCTQRERQVSCYTSALIDSEGKQSLFYAGTGARAFPDLDISHCIDSVYSTSLALLDGAPIETGKYDVIFSHDCLTDVLGAFGQAWSGQAAQKGMTRFKDQVGDTVASPELTLSDASCVEGGLAYAAFDDEGFAAKDTAIIASGILETLLHNSVSAKYFKVQTTANGSRSPKGKLSVASRHLIIDAGPDTDPTAGTYLEIVSLQGIHSGANLVTGNFSFGAQGFLCRDGVRIQAVRGVTVASNFYSLLGRISAIGGQQIWNNRRTLLAPIVRFSDCSVAGS
ncbi:MAG: TldD/PmbA family protein [Myxococcota bacterium]|nr:TldD/PmbA family protein [Myxococcota bacterium]